MTELLKRLSNKARYIQENLEGTIDLRRKRQEEVTKLLEEKKYDKLDGDFKYLVKLPMDSVTEENVEKIMREHEEKQQQLEKLNKITREELWRQDLETLEREL